MRGLVVRFVVASMVASVFWVGALPRHAFASAPSNDNFEANLNLGNGASGTQAGTNVDATFQTDEPDFSGGSVGATVWYTWTAPANSTINFCVYLGTLPDSTLGVYTGNVLATLTFITADDDSFYGLGLGSEVHFSATMDTVYRIQVGGFSAQTGTFTLKWGSDCTAPQTIITSKASGKYSVTVSFTGSDDVTAPGSLTFQCSFDGGGFFACTSPKTYSSVMGGRHMVVVVATDTAGNEDPFPASVSVRAHGSPFKTS